MNGYCIAAYLRESQQELHMPDWLIKLTFYAGAIISLVGICVGALMIERERTHWTNYFNDLHS
jgi:hypothetical protein